MPIIWIDHQQSEDALYHEKSKYRVHTANAEGQEYANDNVNHGPVVLVNLFFEDV
jgi:hypothetical protein